MRLKPPPYLDARQTARFHDLAKAAPPNLLRPSDAVALGCLVLAESLLVDALAKRAADPDGSLLDKGDRGRVVVVGNAVKVQLRAMSMMGSFMQLLGFSPAARNSLPYEMTRRKEDPPTFDEVTRNFHVDHRRRPAAAA
jgi:phage terminase small subunit